MVSCVVVGAGPAGSACALALARSGIDVHLLDQSVFPRTKVCGEYLNSGAVAELRARGLHDRIEPQAHSIGGIALFGSGTFTDMAFDAPAWAIARRVLDAELRAAAAAAGAHVAHARVENVYRTSDGIDVSIRERSGQARTLHARVVVGADGAQSRVARRLNLPSTSSGMVKFALGGHYEGFEGLNDRIEMYVEGPAYFAINPLSATTANVMLVVAASAVHAWRDDVDARLRAAAARLSRGRRNLRNVTLCGKRVAVGPLVATCRRAASLDALLVGDAAAFVDPFTGQGVFLALRSGRLAAAAISDMFHHRSSQSAAWRGYAEEHARLVRDRRRVAALSGWIVRHAAVARPAAAVARISDRPFRRLMQAVSATRALI